MGLAAYKQELIELRYRIAELMIENKQLQECFDECYEELQLTRNDGDKRIAELERKLSNQIMKKEHAFKREQHLIDENLELKKIYETKNEKPCELARFKFLIELSGSAKDCLVVPTFGRSYAKNYREVDMETLEKVGLDGFIKLSSDCDILIHHFAVGLKTCIQLELKYPWTKHALISNVPIMQFCRKGYVYSVLHLIKYKILKALKEQDK